MRQSITENDTLINVPRDRSLMHCQILALKCFCHLTWMDQSREGFFSDLFEIVMVFLTAMNPLEPSFSKILAFILQFWLLAYTHDGMSHPQIYFTALVGCFVIGKFQLFMDLIIIYKTLRKLHSGATRQQFLMSVVFVAVVWYFIPIEMLFFLVLLHEMVNICVNEELNLYQICYLSSAFFLLCYYHHDIDIDCLWQPMEFLRKPILPPELNITLLRKQMRQQRLF